MLLHGITLIHLNFFKFKHKNERNQGKEFTLNFGLKWLGLGLGLGTGLVTKKSGLVLICAPHLVHALLVVPCSKN